MREVGRRLRIHHSTISRYKSRIYKKRKININRKYQVFIKYLFDHYDRRNASIEVCVYKFKKAYVFAPSVTVKQVYNWIEEGKIFITREKLCYKKRKRKSKLSAMMEHFVWNLENKTILPIGLRPKYIEERKEAGHLEIDSILGKKDEKQSVISIVDRCTRKVWLIKSEYKYDYYTANLIYKYIINNDIKIKSMTTDNGLEFKALGIAAKRLGVKLYKCDPYCSFQRGSNERTNAIVRRYLPKGMSFKDTSQITLDNISFNINSMPRKIFGYKCAYDMELNY